MNRSSSFRRRVSPGELWLDAPAKINLTLLVGPRREDGYHPVDSCIARISLFDRIGLRLSDDEAIRLHCPAAECGPAEKNLAYRAARLLAERCPGRGVEIFLEKHIPPGGGLGGGSSDAASVLSGLNELWELHLPDEALRELAETLGSDVPLFLGPAACRATGRGEILEPIEVFPFHAVLALPGLACGTAEVYRAFDALPAARDVPLPTEAFARPPSQWRSRAVNHLAPAAWAVCPALREWHERLATATGGPVSLTGSGAAMFILCDTAEEAQRTLQAIPRDDQPRCRICSRVC